MNKKLTNTKSLHTDLATLLLRVIIGGLFIYHGWSKIMSFGQNISQFPDLIGIGGEISFVLVIFAEFFCGIFVTIGLLTRFAVIPIFITMFVAYFLAHANDPFSGKELPFTFLLVSIIIFILGSGKYSVDKMIQKKKR